MTQTEAMQLIKRTRCKLRPSSSQPPFGQSFSAFIIAMATPKNGEKQIAVGQCKGKTTPGEQAKGASPGGLHL
jgi:hypothetical protein